VATTPDARLSRPSSTANGLGALGVPEPLTTLYELALTHRSYAFERAETTEHNERLEFLGDAILGAVITDYIYSSWPDLSEGEMARLRSAVVNTHSLAERARRLGVGEHLRLGRGEEASGGRDKSSLLADTFEALIGAVYVDRGMDAIRQPLIELFGRVIDDLVHTGDRFDSKTVLQELVVHERGELPTYRIASSGPDHDKRFSAHVLVGADEYGSGEGRSKKEAEQNAARVAIARIESEQGGSDARAS
jgi:ribonuclease-3